jgi:voltage-gated potassium channel
MKRFLKQAFVNSKSKIFWRVSNFFALLTIISILSLILETVPSYEKYQTVFLLIEWTSVILFSFEYLGRLYIAKPRHQYAFSFFGIIDLVAILPTFFGLGNFVFLKSARALRIIRLLRMLRLVKVGRSGLVDEESMGILSLNIVIYFATLTFALLITGTAMYLVEPNLAVFESIPSGMWWSFKVFLASIPVIQPETVLGEALYVFTRFVGLLLLGLLVGVVGNVFKVLVMGGKK